MVDLWSITEMIWLSKIGKSETENLFVVCPLLGSIDFGVGVREGCNLSIELMENLYDTQKKERKKGDAEWW